MRIRPAVSIILPFYNSEKFILRALESVTLWTKSDYEIICVNDGSKDGSLSIVKEFQKLHSQIRIVSFKENRGLYHARLAGIKMARGTYVGFLDSDDYVSNGYFDILYRCASEAKADIAVGQIINVNADGSAYLQLRCATFPYLAPYNEMLKSVYEMFWKQRGLCYHWHVVWNKIYKRELIKHNLEVLQMQEHHLVMMEDFIYSSIFLKDVNTYTVNTSAKYFYVEHNQAVTHMQSVDSIRKSILDRDCAFDFVEKYLKNEPTCQKYLPYMYEWKHLYDRIWKNKIRILGLVEQEQLFPMLSNNEEDLKECDMEDDFYYKLSKKIELY